MFFEEPRKSPRKATLQQPQKRATPLRMVEEVESEQRKGREDKVKEEAAATSER